MSRPRTKLLVTTKVAVAIGRVTALVPCSHQKFPIDPEPRPRWRRSPALAALALAGGARPRWRRSPALAALARHRAFAPIAVLIAFQHCPARPA